MSSWRTARLSAIEPRDGGWIPVRAELEIQAFGINAWQAAEPGDALIGEHSEDLTGHEELYIVLEGHASFTVAGDDIDAPAGTLVFVRDPETRRGAVAREAGTIVLAVGAPAGEPFQVALWEQAWPFTSKAMALYREERFSEAADVLREGIERYPDHGGLHYNLACFESRAGSPSGSVVAHLSRAIEIESRFRDYAAGDTDFDPVRAEPEFIRAVEGDTGPSRVTG